MKHQILGVILVVQTLKQGQCDVFLFVVRFTDSKGRQRN